MEQPGCILVTGAGGFMGRYLLPALHDAFPAARLVATTRSGRTGFERLNVTDRDAVRQIIDAVRPQVCIHLAGITSVPTARQYPEQAWDVNLHGTLTVARALHECMPDATMVYASSSEIYGRSFADGLALNEQALLAPRNTYAASKAAADLALGALCEDGLKAVRLRLFNHTGPGQSPDFAIPAFARQIARIERGLQPPVLNTGALDPARDFLDVRDACAAYVACVQRLAELPPMPC
jgi:GDP-4-dehydro-6-deoxy-D-mannose reductase